MADSLELWNDAQTDIKFEYFLGKAGLYGVALSIGSFCFAKSVESVHLDLANGFVHGAIAGGVGAFVSIGLATMYRTNVNYELRQIIANDFSTIQNDVTNEDGTSAD